MMSSRSVSAYVYRYDTLMFSNVFFFFVRLARFANVLLLLPRFCKLFLVFSDVLHMFFCFPLGFANVLLFFPRLC